MHIHDILIIGAGPCGLAAAARLREETPSATFTDDEHQRYHWIRKHGRKMTIKNHRTNTDSLPTPPPTPETSDCGCEHDREHKNSRVKGAGVDMLVLDADGADWMTRWNRLFATFGIDYLRSPMFFQIDPADRDALLSYAYEMKRDGEVLPLPGCIGKDVSKHRKKKKKREGTRSGKMSQGGPLTDERDRKDYATPSTKLFQAHCEEVVRKYELASEHLVRQERVDNIEYDEVSEFRDSEHDSITSDDASVEEQKVFRITTDKGVHYARIVILAVGAGNAASIPRIPGIPRCTHHEGYCHSMQLIKFPPLHVKTKIKEKTPTNMVVIGGGLTSIQIADLAIQRGVSRVHLLMRGDLKVKYFDLDLDWVAKFRNFNQAAFWSADTDEERLEMLNQARNGGSITPRYRKILQAHINTGKISLHTHTQLTNVAWEPSAKTWTATTSDPSLTLPPLDYIVFATGIQTDIHKIPYLGTLHQQYPIECVGGLPCLNNDIMWRDNVPFFVSGRLAGLRLGPGAANLIGVRVGAERIAWNVQDLLEKMGRVGGKGTVREDSKPRDRLAEYAGGRTNRFNSLVNIDD